jgi:hypothetical protein
MLRASIADPIELAAAPGPVGFVERFGERVILDEVQRAPELAREDSS